MNKFFYITSFNSTMDLPLSFRKKGLNLNFIESIIQLNEELMINHEVLPSKYSVIDSNIKVESFIKEEEFINRISELKNNPLITLDDFIKQHKVTIPLSIERISKLKNNIQQARPVKGTCPKCNQDTIYCTFYAVGLGDPGQTFTHTCATCLTEIESKNTYDVNDTYCFCGHKWNYY